MNAAEMNTLLKDPATVVIDMRNHYEYEVGHFVNALELPSDTFREQLPMAVDMMKGNEEKNIIMYCTGGIRCERPVRSCFTRGLKMCFTWKEVLSIMQNRQRSKGLKRNLSVKTLYSDDRLGERITSDVIAHCHQCGKLCDDHTNCKNDGCHLLFIQCSDCAAEYAGCCSTACKETLHLPVERQKEIRSGIDNGQHIFNKSKARLRPRLEETKDLVDDDVRRVNK